MSADEFQQQVLTPLIPKWRALAADNPDIYQNGVFISMDNATYHKADVLKDVKGLKCTLLPVPPQSHDIQKVVEHAINTLKAAADDYFNDHPEISKIDDIKAAFEMLFKTHITAESVQKDIRSLPGTYRTISRGLAYGGTEGDWPPKRYRCVAVPNARAQCEHNY